MKISELKGVLEETMNIYVEIFRKKHNLSLMGWVGNDVGGVVCLGDYFFNFDDIRIDLENDVPKEKIIEWYDYSLENPDSSWNYKNWLMKN